MLADIYFHYAQWAISEEDRGLANKAIEAAIKNCSLAKKHLEKSTYSIFNASLGRGLASSNSFNIESPEEVQDILIKWLQRQNSETTLHL
jgi:hypothetical protein